MQVRVRYTKYIYAVCEYEVIESEGYQGDPVLWYLTYYFADYFAGDAAANSTAVLITP